MKDVFIIAEAGVNHNGDYKLAFALIDAAVLAGADAIKFQTFLAENVVTKKAKKAAYQELTTSPSESQFDMIKKLELPYEWHFDLLKYCKKKGIEFLSTAFDLDSLNFLVNDIKIKTLKIASGEITNGPFLLACAQKQCNLIVSTGMATLGEIEKALSIIAFGFLNETSSLTPHSTLEFQKAYCSSRGKQLLKERVTLLHCTTEYPTPPSNVNLGAMKSIHSAFGIDVGYSDHSKGITVPIVATTLGATIIEKHFTIDRSLPGPDHKASLEPDELKDMIKGVRMVKEIMGDGLKIPMPLEVENKSVARKSLIAATDISIGDTFTSENLTAKRPGTGISPMLYWNYLGKKSKKNYELNDLIDDER